MEPKWEIMKTIDHGIFRNRIVFSRMKVPGGWLFKHIDIAGINGHARHDVVYFPECEKPWDIAKEPIAWEKVEFKGNPNYRERTWRCAVPGGWIVLCGYYPAGKRHSHVSLTYVPDRQHLWRDQEADHPAEEKE